MTDIQPTLALHPEGSRRVYLPAKGLWAKAQELEIEGTSFVSTAHSVYVPKTRTKYLNADDCSYWFDLNNRSVLMTPGEIARTELKREFGNPKIWVKKTDFAKLDFPVPQYYDGIAREGRLFYVDLNAAYHQIYQHLTLDIVWPRGLGMLYLKPVADRLKDHKLARNALVGVTRSNQIFLDTPEGQKRLFFTNPYLNPSLWRTIQSILHEIATVAISNGCHYVATDGYIFSDAFHFGFFTAFLSDCGFAFKTEKGDGYIHGWASYKVGKKKTLVKATHPRKIDKIVRTEKGCVEWLKKVKTNGHCP